MLNAAFLLEMPARYYPAKTAIIDPDVSITYAELDRYARQVAHGLQRHGLKENAHIGLIAPTSRHFVAAYFGILKAGMVAVPINTRLRVQQFADLLAFADVEACLIVECAGAPPAASDALEGAMQVQDCRAIWVHAPAMPGNGDARVQPWSALLEDCPDEVETVLRGADDIALLNYTSGTTARPRAAQVTHASDLMFAPSFQQPWGITENDTIAGAIGLFTGYGRVAWLNPGLYCGATLVFWPTFDPPRIIEAMQKANGTGLHGVPAMFHAVRQGHRDGQYDLTSLRPHWRHILYGGAPMRRDLRAFYGEEMGVATVQGYGLTECNAIAQSPPDARPAAGMGDPLRPVWGHDVRVVDEHRNEAEIGEVIVRGPGLMTGYYKNPEETNRVLHGQWLHTGDQARRLPSGDFELLGRRCDTINRGGFMVYPAELEMLLLEHPAVDAAAVKGVPDDRLGEEVVAYIVPSSGAQVSQEQLREWLKDRLASFQCPRHFVFMDAFPLGPTGKVEKHALPALESDALPADESKR